MIADPHSASRAQTQLGSPAPRNAFHRAILGGVLGFVLIAGWPGVHASVFMLAAAIYFALPREHRTRSNASLVGWSVGFAIVFLGWFIRNHG